MKSAMGRKVKILKRVDLRLLEGQCNCSDDGSPKIFGFICIVIDNYNIKVKSTLILS